MKSTGIEQVRTSAQHPWEGYDFYTIVFHICVCRCLQGECLCTCLYGCGLGIHRKGIFIFLIKKNSGCAHGMWKFQARDQTGTTAVTTPDFNPLSHQGTPKDIFKNRSVSKKCLEQMPCFYNCLKNNLRYTCNSCLDSPSQRERIQAVTGFLL